MITSRVYITPDHIHHASPVDGAVEKILLESENGKVLHNDSLSMNYVRVAVESADGWTEIDAPVESEEPTIEDKAEAYDILIGVSE